MHNLHSRKSFLFSILLSTFFLFSVSGCTLSRMIKTGEARQEISVEPTVLAVNGNVVPFDLKVKVPAEVTGKKPVYNVVVAYQYGKKQTEPVTRLRFAPGEFIYENGTPTINRQLSFPYTPEKASGKLVAQAEAVKPNGRVKRGKVREIAPGVITTSRLTVKANAVSLAPDTYRKGVSEPELLTFFFDEGKAELRDYLGTNMDVLKELLQSNYKIQAVEITTGHSPEEADSKDPKLARKRAQTFEKYMRHQLDVNSYTNTNQSVKFKVQPVVRNWERFLKQVQLSALSPEQVNQILDIINGPGSFRDKEKQLSKLDSYDYLQLYIYPALRYADVRITYNVPQKKDSEIYLLSRKIVENRIDADKLTEEELRYAATLTPLLSEKLAIYQAAAENTMKWQAFNNLGVTYVQMAQQAVKPTTRDKMLREAIVNLTYASHRNPTAQLFYNLGSAQYLLGNYPEALQSYDYALKLGGPVPVLQQVFADKAALEIETGRLDEAVVSLAYAGTSYQSLMNKGLIYLLKGNYEQAQTFYEEALVLKPNDALAHYSLAVLAARTNQPEALASHLHQATRQEKSLTAKAIDDPEFRNFVGTPTFREALK
ncbi:tetratricopeptide repeat protein [Adhaeribacter soli]|uniref:Tetratricopeptide repeat protein n=1 Tax=Adhaeribacter soli TaxID=2607655 RepID=A0A5N1J6S1_9BACT|nr:tetratricopeptide repeat protein [Adhaeribacter soli]KAA9345823.1 tetratricopeptide repeat protein [Adhaeribacter soli]